MNGKIPQFELKDRVFVGTDVCISTLGAVFAAVTKTQTSPAPVRDGQLMGLSKSLAGECLVFTTASSCDVTVELLSFLDSQVMAGIECLLAVLLSSTVPVLFTVPHHVCDCMYG